MWVANKDVRNIDIKFVHSIMMQIMVIICTIHFSNALDDASQNMF